ARGGGQRGGPSLPAWQMARAVGQPRWPVQRRLGAPAAADHRARRPAAAAATLRRNRLVPRHRSGGRRDHRHALIRREEAEMTRTLYKYEPDFAVAPGETLKEVLEDLGMSQAELATRTGLSPKHVNQVIQGHVGLTPDMAARLEPVVGVPARIWN